MNGTADGASLLRFLTWSYGGGGKPRGWGVCACMFVYVCVSAGVCACGTCVGLVREHPLPMESGALFGVLCREMRSPWRAI